MSKNRKNKGTRICSPVKSKNKKIRANSRRKKWYLKKPNPKFDIRLLCSKFETFEDAKWEQNKRINLLLSTGKKKDRELAMWLKLCKRNRRCESHACPVCTRRYRIWLCGQIMRLVKKYHNVKFVTLIMPDIIKSGKLGKKSILLFKNRLWQQFKRTGSGNAIVLGGFEADFNYHKRKWETHFHLHVVNPDPVALEELRKRYYKHTKKRHRPMQVDHSDCSGSTLLYGFKSFSKYKGPCKGRVRLEKKELIESLHFWSKHRLHERAFMQGMKRSGNKFKSFR